VSCGLLLPEVALRPVVLQKQVSCKDSCTCRFASEIPLSCRFFCKHSCKR